MPSPLLAAVALDNQTEDVLEAAAELAQRLDAPLLPVHALGWRPGESKSGREQRIARAREQLQPHLETVRSFGAEVLEPVIARGRPHAVVEEAAQRTRAQMIMTGGGGPVTVRRWVIGSVAERIVRTSVRPVWIARGAMPIGMPILCPVDLSPQSRLGFTLAVRMARLFKGPLIALTVLPEEGEKLWVDAESLEERVGRTEETARERLGMFMAAHDLEGVDVEARVVIGPPADVIVDESREVGLLVMASRYFDRLEPTNLGGVSERALRYSRCSAIAIRDPDAGRDAREARVRELARLKVEAEALLDRGDAEAALPILQLAAREAPANAAVQEALARALEAVGRPEEAATCRALAVYIRSSFG